MHASIYKQYKDREKPVSCSFLVCIANERALPFDSPSDSFSLDAPRATHAISPYVQKTVYKHERPIREGSDEKGFNNGEKKAWRTLRFIERRLRAHNTVARLVSTKEK